HRGRRVRGESGEPAQNTLYGSAPAALSTSGAGEVSTLAERFKSFPVVDVDARVLEPAEVWKRYLDPDYRVVARSSFWHEIGPSGVETTILNGKPAPPLSQRGIPRYAIWRPGMKPEDIGALNARER